MLKITASIKYTMNKNIFPVNFVYYPVWFEVNFPVCRNPDRIKFRRDMTPLKKFFKRIGGFFNFFENKVCISGRIMSCYILINIQNMDHIVVNVKANIFE